MLAFGTALAWTFDTLFMKKTSTIVDPFWTVSFHIIFLNEKITINLLVGITYIYKHYFC
jgi:hypothetical protein